MRTYITTEANLDIPGPNAERLLAHLRTLFDGTTPVTARSLALSLGGDTLAIESVLRRASHSGLVREVAGKGWLPVAN